MRAYNYVKQMKTDIITTLEAVLCVLLQPNMSAEPTSELLSGRISELRALLSNLPGNVTQSDGAHYPFLTYEPDPESVESSGSRQGALNQLLEHTFGSRHERISTGQTPVEFRYRGPDLLALADVLQSHLLEDSSENTLLIKWLDDFIISANITIQQVRYQCLSFRQALRNVFQYLYRQKALWTRSLVQAIAIVDRLTSENRTRLKKKHARDKRQTVSSR